MYRTLAVLALFVPGVATLSAQGGQQDSTRTAAAVRDSRAAAVAGLDTLRALARTQARTLGFTDANEAAGATLTEPVVVYYVRLDSLRTFSTQTDPVSLLSGGDEVIYPVMVSSAVRSSVQVARTRERWRPVSYGGRGLTSSIVRQRAALAAASGLPAAAYFAVRVPALGLYFLGLRTGSALTLAPLRDDPRGRWKAGVMLPARDIFGGLVADARASNGLPI